MYSAVFGLFSMGAALSVTITYGAVFDLLSMGAALAVATPAMLDSRPVMSIPRRVYMFGVSDSLE
jgi:hypothetical protein